MDVIARGVAAATAGSYRLPLVNGIVHLNIDAPQVRVSRRAPVWVFDVDHVPIFALRPRENDTARPCRLYGGSSRAGVVRPPMRARCAARDVAHGREA